MIGRDLVETKTFWDPKPLQNKPKCFRDLKIGPLELKLPLKYFVLVFWQKSFYRPLPYFYIGKSAIRATPRHPYTIPFQVKLQGECWAPPPPVFGPCRVKSIRLTNDLFGRWYRCRHGNNCKSVNWRECMTTIFPYIKQGWNDL